MGRAAGPARPRHRGAAGQGGQPHRLAGAHLRPGLRPAGGARLPAPTATVTDAGRMLARHLDRGRPAGGRVPAPRGVGRDSTRPSWPPPCRWWSTRPAARSTSAPSVPRGPVGRRGRRDREALVGAGGGRGRARAAADPRARPGLRLADLPLGPGRDAVQGAGQRPPRRHAGRRLRPLGPAGGRPARPDRRGRRAPTAPMRATARSAMDALNRGVLAYSTVAESYSDVCSPHWRHVDLRNLRSPLCRQDRRVPGSVRRRAEATACTSITSRTGC